MIKYLQAVLPVTMGIGLMAVAQFVQGAWHHLLLLAGILILFLSIADTACRVRRRRRCSAGDSKAQGSTAVTPKTGQQGPIQGDPFGPLKETGSREGAGVAVQSDLDRGSSDHNGSEADQSLQKRWELLLSEDTIQPDAADDMVPTPAVQAKIREQADYIYELEREVERYRGQLVDISRQKVSLSPLLERNEALEHDLRNARNTIGEVLVKLNAAVGEFQQVRSPLSDSPLRSAEELIRLAREARKELAAVEQQITHVEALVGGSILQDGKSEHRALVERLRNTLTSYSHQMADTQRSASQQAARALAYAGLLHDALSYVTASSGDSLCLPETASVEQINGHRETVIRTLAGSGVRCQQVPILALACAAAHGAAFYLRECEPLLERVKHLKEDQRLVPAELLDVCQEMKLGDVLASDTQVARILAHADSGTIRSVVEDITPRRQEELLAALATYLSDNEWEASSKVFCLHEYLSHFAVPYLRPRPENDPIASLYRELAREVGNLAATVRLVWEQVGIRPINMELFRTRLDEVPDVKQDSRIHLQEIHAYNEFVRRLHEQQKIEPNVICEIHVWGFETIRRKIARANARVVPYRPSLFTDGHTD